jgi:hypothetical protein
MLSISFRWNLWLQDPVRLGRTGIVLLLHSYVQLGIEDHFGVYDLLRCCLLTNRSTCLRKNR